MPSRGSKRNLLAGMGPLTPPASDEEADDDASDRHRANGKLTSIRENGSAEQRRQRQRPNAPAESSSNHPNGAPSSMLGPRGVEPLKGDGDDSDSHDDETGANNSNNARTANVGSGCCGGDEKKDDTIPPAVVASAAAAAQMVLEIEGTLLGGSSQGDLNVVDATNNDNNDNDNDDGTHHLQVHEPPEHRTAEPRRSSLKQALSSAAPPPPTSASPARRTKSGGGGGGNARRPSASSIASEAESECSLTLEAIGPALAAFGGGGGGGANSNNRNDASGVTASTSNRSNVNNNNNNNSGGSGSGGGGGAGPPSSSLRARPGLLVKQKTARNVQTAKTASFVQTAGMRRATERHMRMAAQQQQRQQQQQQQRNSHNSNTSDPSLGSFGSKGACHQANQATTDGGRPRSGSGGSSSRRRMPYGRRISGVSHASSIGRGESSSQLFGESMHLSGLADPDEYLEIDLCDECLHCPSLTALRQSFHESLLQGDNACSKAENESGRLPLHCIGLNRDLILLSTGNVGASIARVDDFILKELLPAYPSAIIIEDDEGRLPFTEVIIKWISARRAVRLWKSDYKKKKAAAIRRKSEAKARKQQAKMAKRFSVSSSGWGSGHGGDDDDEDYGDDYAAYMETPEEKDDDDSDELADKDDDDISVESLGKDVLENIREVCGEEEEDDDDEEIHDLPPLVEWSLRVLSAIIDQSPSELGCAASNLALKAEMSGGGHNSGKSLVSSDGSEAANQAAMNRKRPLKRPSFMAQKSSSAVNEVYDDIVVEKLASIPHLVEELLLIEDKAARARVFELSIVHKVLFSANSLGDGKWLVNMLNKGIHAGAHVNVYYAGSRLDRAKSIRHLGRRSSLASQDSLRNVAWGRSSQTSQTGFFGGRSGSLSSLLGTLGSGANSNSKSGSSSLDKAAKVVGLLEENDGFRYAEAGVFYLESISSLNIQDDLHVLHHIQMARGQLSGANATEMINGSDMRHFRKKRDALYDTIGSICGLIRILCVLDPTLVTRATMTPVVQRALDKRIFSPFAMTIAVIDGIIHFLLILSFRLGPAPAMFHLNPLDGSFRPFQYLFANMLLFACVAHFIIKEIQLSFAKYNLSPRLFWSDFFTFWNLIDVVPLFFVAFCAIAVDLHLRWRALDESCVDSTIPFYLRVAVATTTPFLWLRVLGHLKMWNKQLATFILCSVEIMKDIKWFMLVLMIAMSSFAQMFVSLTFEPMDANSPEAPRLGGQYQYFSLEGYLKAYTLMLGDFDSLSLRKHPSITLLFILYTFGVTVVLLNILIAIVSESYATSTTTSKTMLGKARILFVSELSSLHQFFRKTLQGDVKLREAQQNMDVVGVVIGAIVTKLFVSTAKAHLGRSGGGSPGWLFHSSDSYWFDLEALCLFAFFVGAMGVIKFTMHHIQRNFRYSSSVAQHDIEVKSVLTQKINDIIEDVYAIVSRGVDFLTEEDDNKLLALSAQAAGGDGGETTGMNQTEIQLTRLRKMMQANKKEMKSEVKGITDSLRHALTETEVQQNNEMVGVEERLQMSVDESRREIASMIEASEDRMIRAITGALCAVGEANGSGIPTTANGLREKLNLYRPEREDDLDDDDGQWSDYD